MILIKRALDHHWPVRLYRRGVRMGHFSAIAGAVALGIIAMPVMVRTTEDMLNLVPKSMRDGSAGLGAQPWRTITQIIYPAARSGILTGLLLAVARVSGETAPLLFTALNNQFWTAKLNEPMANLPVVIFQFAMSRIRTGSICWAGALLITGFVLILSIIARSVATLFGQHVNPVSKSASAELVCPLKRGLVQGVSHGGKRGSFSSHPQSLQR